MERCAEQVFSGARWDMGGHRCSRNAGHGEGGKYCKQHALKHPAEGETIETITAFRVAKKWEHELREVEVLRLTDNYVLFPNGRREAKNSEYFQYFETRRAALVAYRDRLVRQRDNGLRLVAEAERLLAEMEAGDE